MYKTTVYTERDEFIIKTEDEVSFYQEGGLGYLTNKSGIEIFAVNIAELTAIKFNDIDETKTGEIEIDIDSKEIVKILSESIKEQLYNKHQRR